MAYNINSSRLVDKFFSGLSTREEIDNELKYMIYTFLKTVNIEKSDILIAVATHLSNMPNLFKGCNYTKGLAHIYMNFATRINLEFYPVVNHIDNYVRSQMIKCIIGQMNKNDDVYYQYMLESNLIFLLKEYGSDNPYIIDYNILFNYPEEIDNFIAIVNKLYDKKRCIDIYYTIYKYHILSHSLGNAFSEFIPKPRIIKIIFSVYPIHKFFTKVFNKRKHNISQNKNIN